MDLANIFAEKASKAHCVPDLEKTQSAVGAVRKTNESWWRLPPSGCPGDMNELFWWSGDFSCLLAMHSVPRSESINHSCDFIRKGLSVIM